MIRMISVIFLGFVSDLYGFVSFQYDSLTSIPVHSHFSHRHQVTARMKTRSTMQSHFKLCLGQNMSRFLPSPALLLVGPAAVHSRKDK